MLGNNLICTGVKVEESVKYLYYTRLHARARKERLCKSKSVPNSESCLYQVQFFNWFLMLILPLIYVCMCIWDYSICMLNKFLKK